MEKIERAKIITKVVWGSIMIVAGVILWFIGLAGFNMMQDLKVMAWFIWGIITSPFMIPYMITVIKDSAKRGRQEGANTYTASRIGNTVTVSNNPIGGMIKGAIIGLIVSVFAGPIITPIFSLKRLGDLIKNIKILISTKEQA